MVLTPFLLAAFRRWPLRAALTPLVVVGLDAVLGWNVQSAGAMGTELIDFCTFATCWMVGFAHRDGTLRRLHPVVLVTVASTAIILGGGWAWSRPHAGGLDLGAIPLAQGLVSAGVVLLLFRVSPHLAWLDRSPLFDRTVTITTIRAATIYLTTPIAVALATTVAGGTARPLLAAALVVVGVVVFGWIEDVAARRPVQLLPLHDTTVPNRRPSAHTGRTPDRPPDIPSPRGESPAALPRRFTRHQHGTMTARAPSLRASGTHHPNDTDPAAVDRPRGGAAT